MTSSSRMAASRRRLTYTKIRNNLLIQEKNLMLNVRIFERDVKIDNAGINKRENNLLRNFKNFEHEHVH